MATPFYSAIKNFDMFDEIIQEQSENPTNSLNLMLRNGATRNQFAFLREGSTEQFSFGGKGWMGIRRHIRFCEKNGWEFSLDFDDFLSYSKRGEIFKIIGFKRRSGRTIKPKKQSQRRNLKIRVYDLNARLSDILSAVKDKVHHRVDSLDSVFRFKRSCIEAWFKVEVVAALGEQVTSLNNRGPDMTLTDGLHIELKAATDFNPSYYRDGALKDGVPCLFLGNGENEKNMNRLKSMKRIRVIGLHCFSGLHTWAIGCIVPAEDT